MKSLSYWESLVNKINLPNKGIVDGKAVESISGATFDCINPATSNTIASVAAFDSEDIDRAVTSSRHAFEKSGWRTGSIAKRRLALLRLAELIEANAESLALMDTISMGKTIRSSLNGDVPGAVEFFRWYAEALSKLFDQVAPSDNRSLITIRREAVGVVGLITPWNYPLEEAAMKIAPALALGNSVIIKPPELSPFSCIRLGELALEAGIPPGVLNVAPGLGPIAGKALGLHNHVDCIGFTGSTRVGKLLMQYAGQSNLKPVWLECGGKNPNIIFSDCVNVAFAAKEAARSVFRNQGEVCTAGSRLMIERSLKNKFLEQLIKESLKYVPGNPLDPETTMGPIASKTQYERVLDFIDKGEKEGATLILDGRRNQGESQFFIGPTIFDNVTNDMTIAREEIFGPVISVMSFDNVDEVITLANDTIYGLGASVWTCDQTKAYYVSQQLIAGAVTVNGMDSQDVSVPFGGCKQSGIGREHGLSALDLYSNSKVVWYHN